MRRMIALLLVLSICLSLWGCSGEALGAQKKTPEAAEQGNNNEIAFNNPIVVAEDENVRVELVKFYQDYFRWNEMQWPVQATASVKETTLENVVVFKFHNKCNHDLRIEAEEFYLGSDGAHNYGLTGTLTIAVGKNGTAYYLIQTGEKETLKSMEELHSLDGEFEIYHQGDDGVLRNRYELKFSIPNALTEGSVSTAHVSNNSDAWKQFRDYLREHGPVTVVTDKTNYGQNQVTIEENAGDIQVSHVGEATSVSGGIRAHTRNSMRFRLLSNVKTVTVQIEYLMEGTDENGNRREQSGSPNYIWDIQNYHSGDVISFTMDYSDLDSNGNYIQKTGTLTSTKSFAEVTDALSLTLIDSGIGITMADLGFTNY